MTNIKSVESRVTITITTRNRWTDLKKTLSFLKSQGFGEFRILIADNGSDVACDPEVARGLRHATIIRSEVSLGLVEQRNALAALVRTDYLLCLDDDSFPSRTFNLATVVQFLDNNPSVAAVALDVVERSTPGRTQARNSVAMSNWAPIRSFIGCGHVIRVNAFVAAGGYRGDFIREHEERELCMRWASTGLSVVYTDQARVIHMRSPHGRDTQSALHLRSRNVLRSYLLNTPILLLPWVVLKASVWLLIFSLKDLAAVGPTIRGISSALANPTHGRPSASRMSLVSYRKWTSLPFCPTYTLDQHDDRSDADRWLSRE